MTFIKLFYAVINMNVVTEIVGVVHAAAKLLWGPGGASDDLTICTIDSMIEILENPEVCKASGKNIVIPVFHVLRVLCVHWDQNKGFIFACYEMLFIS